MGEFLHGLECYINAIMVPHCKALIATMLAQHRAMGTWTEKVNAYITLTKFCRTKMIEARAACLQIFVKPNFVSSDNLNENIIREYALFVGRLSYEKGIITLLRAWAKIEDIPLKIVGEGPMKSDIEGEIGKSTRIQFLGYLDRNTIVSMMKKATFLVFPSEIV